MSQPPLQSPPDRLIDAEKEERIPDSWRKQYLQRSLDELPRDVVHLYDLTWNQKRELDRKQKDILELQAALEAKRRSDLINWIVTAGQFFGLIAALIKAYSR